MERRRSQHQLRSLRTVMPLSGASVRVDDRTMINFCSNDYLGLSKHPLLRERATEFMERYGTGSTASRLICGTYDCFERVEQKLAALKGTESALILNAGFQTNVSLLPTLTDNQSLVLSDRLNHNSLIQGILLSGCRKAIFHHNDMNHLRRLLEESRKQEYSRVLIVTESVYSMDGDRSDIDCLIELADEYQGMLMVDDAHATGVLGIKGMGLTCGKNIDIMMGTFGKALGSFGSYIACSNRMRDYLINCCAGIIYTTALPPPVLGAIDAALDLVPEMEQERRELHRKADFLRNKLNELRYNTGYSSTQIVPVIIGDETEALALSDWLDKNGFLCIAIRPPTVARAESRIRLALSASHTWSHVEQLVETLKKWRQKKADRLKASDIS